MENPRDPSKDYVYLPLSDALKSVNQKVNLFGLVCWVGTPKMSKGTDYVLTLKIIDQSYSMMGISVNFFAESTEKLPHVKSVGDIISLHRVVMKIHEGEYYCLYNKKFSSYALYDRETTAGSSFYQSSEKFHATTDDDEFLLQLRTWSNELPPETYMSHVNVEQSILIRRINTDGNFDLICKVIHVSETSNSERVLFVWDGTDAPPVNIDIDLDHELESPCPLYFEEMPPSTDISCRYPRIGTIFRVLASNYIKDLKGLQGGGPWIKLCNITCELQAGMWNGMLQPSSVIHVLSDGDWIVRQRLRSYDDRLASELDCHPLASLPFPSPITEIDYEHAAYSSLRESLNHHEVTHKCMCIVRVVAACPWRADDLQSPITGRYRVRLTLEDPTARVHAYISGEDAEKFFGGYPPSDVLTRKMNSLLGTTDITEQASGDHPRSPPWVWCCLKSYYVDKNNQRGSRKYRIFATTLVG